MEKYKDKYPDWFDTDGNYILGSLENRIERVKDELRNAQNVVLYGGVNASNIDELRAELAFLTTDDVTKLDNAKAAKISEINAYDKSDAVNSFTLDDAAVWLDKDTRVGLMNSVTIEKAAGREETTLWFPIGGTPQKIVINVDKAIQMLAALELYALACYNATAAHIANVGKLTDEAEIEAYDYTTGYPDKLNLSTK